MSLETKSKELKELMATFDTRWVLGDLSFIMHAGRERAADQLGELSSPQRQLYYLAGLNVSSAAADDLDIMYDPEKWAKIVRLLNEIENEYQRFFFPENPEDVQDDWVKAVKVAMPSFLGYFNQGPLNYEEQVINWIVSLFVPLDQVIFSALGLHTKDFITFYERLDQLIQRNFMAHSGRKDLLRADWEKYTNIQSGIVDEAPDFIRAIGEEHKHQYKFMTDKGMKDRFYSQELVAPDLPIEKVEAILSLLSCKRSSGNFLYYTETRPGNPLYERPIVDLEDGMFQVFEMKQVIHAIEMLLEKTSTQTQAGKDKYVDEKGSLLEDRIEELFSKLLKKDYKVFRGYYVDGCEQDILILWKKRAFVIEAKGYAIREPFRNPEKAFIRINDDFKDSIGYGYVQTRRVEQKFIDEIPLLITGKDGKLIEEIDTTQYDLDFSIIVNLKSFGHVQCDLSSLLKVEDGENYPWAVKLDDLEIFILTLIAQKRSPEIFVDFLLMRENLHGHLVCSDELEICGGFLSRKLTQKIADSEDVIITAPDLGEVFDKQYAKGMGFKNERMLTEKQSGNYLFW